MNPIPAYKFEPPRLSFEPSPRHTPAALDSAYARPIRIAGGYDSSKKTLQPLRFSTDFSLYIYLDSITASVEGGLVEDQRWPRQLFHAPEDFQRFIDALAALEGVRIHDRWAHALAALCVDPGEVHGMNTPRDFAEALAGFAGIKVSNSF